MTALPELRRGDRLVNPALPGKVLVVARRRNGDEYDEPIYRLRGMYGVILRNKYTGEQLAGEGWQLLEGGETT